MQSSVTRQQGLREEPWPLIQLQRNNVWAQDCKVPGAGISILNYMGHNDNTNTPIFSELVSSLNLITVVCMLLSTQSHCLMTSTDSQFISEQFKGLITIYAKGIQPLASGPDPAPEAVSPVGIPIGLKVWCWGRVHRTWSQYARPGRDSGGEVVHMEPSPRNHWSRATCQAHRVKRLTTDWPMQAYMLWDPSLHKVTSCHVRVSRWLGVWAWDCFPEPVE